MAMLATVTTGTNIDLTDSLTTHVEETFEGVLGKFQNLKISNNVYLEVSKNAANPLHTCETTMTIENGPTIRSKSSSPDMYGSVTDCASKAKRKLRKFKDRFRRGHHKDVPSFTFDDPDDSSPEDTYTDANPETPEVTKIKSFDLSRPIPLSEAVWALDYVDHDFYVYRDDKTNEINVVYKRNGGGVGVIQPE
ncbi:hypothetical protein TrVE_jg6640 [Triparma verrucosa]|uniref:Sigma 54 modulation/S30EA ribosomal protein C-terminal domain-containing protein n=2 Tax=Triparma TaxID=722752 RepID=A0A9W7AM60_9STRA|nr:hypothetical protein TrST_g1481 [Triparma strigata]GMH96652.1 hypothetical protein TrVE_jg6640 [Triparma verrucosa]